MSTDVIKRWLKPQLDQLVSIQTTQIRSDAADLVAFAWSGVRVNIHLVQEPLNVRTIKRTLQEATSIGVSTLFLLDANLFPPDGQRLKIKDWLVALQSLTHEYVYAYRFREQGLALFQVHFELINNGSDEHKVWYGPEVPFERIRFYRSSVKLRSIKGDWLVADFDTPPFWRNTDYRQYRTKQDRTASHRNTTWQTWGAYQTTWDTNTTNPSRPASASPFQDHLIVCYQLLEVELSASQDDVKRAFRKQALRYHPDTSELPAEEAEEKFRLVNKAYEYIKSAKGWS